MAMNDFSIERTVVGSFTLPNSSATSNVGSGVYIPAGAIITGIRILSPDAVTLTGALGTVQLRVGTTPIAAAVAASGLPAASAPATTALLTTAGVFSPGGELNLQCQASSQSAATATYDYYIDYLYFNS